MARGINKVILVGNLGADPEIKYMPSGDALATLSIATSETWKDKQSGDRVERTEWHRVVLFKRRAEVAGEYLRKGSKVYIEGKLQTRKWQAQDGSDRYTTEIVANEMQMLDSKNGSQPASGNGNSNGKKGKPTSQASQAYANASGGHVPDPDMVPMGVDDDFEDLIPF